MNTFTATLRQDLRAQRWLLGALFVFLLLARALQAGWFPPKSQLVETLQPLFYIAPVLAWFFCLGRLVYTHAPNDDRVAWRTRPLDAATVGLTKLGFGLLLLVFLPALIMAIGPAGQEAASRALWWIWLSQARGLLVVFAGLFFLCTLCRSSRELLLALAGLAALLMLTISGLSILGPTGNRWTINLVRGLDEVPAFVLPAGLLVLAVRQYQRPRTLQPALLGAGWVLAVTATGLALYLRQPQVEQLSATGVTARVSDAALVNDAHDLAATVEITGLDPAAIWQFEFWSAPPRFP